MRRLRDLEALSINILREAYDNLDLALAWSKGTESTVLLWLARKAFNGQVPIPLIQVDSGYTNPELVEYRDRVCREWRLNPVVKQTNHGRNTRYECTDLEMIGEAMRAHYWTAVILDTCASRGDKPTNAHHFALYRAYSEGDLLAHQPEIWDPHRRSLPDDSHVRVHPLLDWTELDVWEYIEREQIPLPRLDLDQENFMRLRSLAWVSSPGVRQSYVASIS